MNAPTDPHWTATPARWAAVAVLGTASVIGVGRGLVSPGERAPVTAAPSAHHAVRAVPEHPAAGFASRSIVPEQSGHVGQAEQSEQGVPPAAADGSPDIAVRIDINSAGAAELELLPRIGPVLAQRIIDERAASGPFRSLADLQRVRGIGPKTAAKLGPLIRFDARTASATPPR